jgi:hypothetical protein
MLTKSSSDGSTDPSRLDSRLRKKQNAEKLEVEKNTLSGEKQALEAAIAHLQDTLQQEQQQRMHEHQEFQAYVQQLTYERDEAIRTKTLETADLRRKNNLLQDTLRDMERQLSVRAYANDSDNFSSDFNSFKALDLEDNWDDGFSLINSDDLKMDQDDALQRQATPRPPTSATQSSSTPATKSDVKIDAAFSWETFYMCLLSGAFIMSQAGSKAASASTSVAIAPPTMPSMSDEYRAEAGNVLQAVLATNPDTTHEVLPCRPAHPTSASDFPHTMSDHHDTGLSPGHHDSSLNTLHTALTTPSRHQQLQASFSLSAEAYDHISSPDLGFDSPVNNANSDKAVVENKPTSLQRLFAEMQAERDQTDKMTGLGSKARERSVLLDYVPEKVLRDFREMIARLP